MLEEEITRGPRRGRDRFPSPGSSTQLLIDPAMKMSPQCRASTKCLLNNAPPVISSCHGTDCGFGRRKSPEGPGEVARGSPRPGLETVPHPPRAPAAFARGSRTIPASAPTVGRQSTVVAARLIRDSGTRPPSGSLTCFGFLKTEKIKNTPRWSANPPWNES